VKTSSRFLAALLAALGLLAAPAHRAPARAAVGRAAIAVVDDQGTRVVLPAVPRRIIALAPNVTEILFALGLGREVVGVSSFSDYPAAAKRLPVVITYNGLNTEKILALKPDLLIAAGIVPQTSIDKLRSLHLPVLVTAPSDIPGILKDIRLVGAATGTGPAAMAEVGGLQRRIDRVEASVGRIEGRPRVFYEIDPTLYTAGHGSFIDSLITLADGTNIAGKVNNPYPQLSAEKVIAANPQYILLSDTAEGVTVASVAARPGFAALSAVKHHHIYPFDPNIGTRPGPRIVDALEVMARDLHPGLVLR